MSRFDFIIASEFKTSLENDYNEMSRCHEAKSWKSVQVLAGSIVEALLIDYIVSFPELKSKSKDPLKLDLSEAVTICKSNGVISERTADLCSVVRSYRNLIHPGRQVRLKETAPSAQSAGIALQLVDMIADEVEGKRKGAFGFTAEQILAKLEYDHNCLSILPHLLKEVHESELIRLLCYVLPDRYEKLWAIREDPPPFDQSEDVPLRLSRGFRLALNGASDAAKQRVIGRFPEILKNEGGHRIDLYFNAFFLPDDMKFIPEKDRAIVKDYLFAQLPNKHSEFSVKGMAALAQFIDKKEMSKWIDPFIRCLIDSKASHDDKDAVRNELVNAQWPVSTSLETAMDERIDVWIRHLEKSKKADLATILEQMKADIQAARF